MAHAQIHSTVHFLCKVLMLRFVMDQTEPDGTALGPLWIYVGRLRMNPGNAGVHVSLLRKEINETNRERRRYSYDRKCSKLESFL